jgi:hypothetical protein
MVRQLMSLHLEGSMHKSPRTRKPSRRGGHSRSTHPATTVKTGRRPAPDLTKISKQAKLLDLLRKPAGATIAALSEVSGWQQHSVRGFLAGVVRKKLGLELVSAVEADQRIYRIVAARRA